MQVHRRAVDDGEIHFAAVQPLDQMAAIALHDAQRDVRKFVDDAAGKRPDSTALTVGTSPRMTRPDGLPFADLRSSLTCSIWRIRPVVRSSSIRPALVRSMPRPLRTNSSTRKLVLEQLDVPAQRRLGGAQPVRRLAEAAEFGHGAEGP